MTLAGISIDWLADGKFEETWDNYDALGMMQQLGVKPAPGRAREGHGSSPPCPRR
jgi:hypothetical protein